MPINFVRMVQFTRLVKAEGRLREFNFRKLKQPGEELFSVNVCNERGERIIFSMQKNGSDWKIIPGEMPAWITQSERKLNEEIETALAQHDELVRTHSSGSEPL